MPTYARTAVLAIAVALTAASCSAGSGANRLLPATGPGSAGLQIHIPRHVRKHAHYVSPSTRSLTLALSPAAGCAKCTPASSGDYGLTPDSPGCTTDASGITCRIQLALAPGSYTGKIATYDGAVGCQKLAVPCSVLSQNQSFPLTIASGKSNVPSITLAGVLRGFVFVNLTPASLQADASRNLVSLAPGTSGRLELLPKDADGNIILGPGTPDVSVAGGKKFTVSAKGNVITISAPMHPSTGRDYLPVTLKSCTSSCSLGNIGATFLTLVAEGYSGGNAVAVMPTFISSTAAYAVITNGINTPKAEVFNSSGDLFVANAGSDKVTEYAPPYSSAPIAVLSGVTAPDLLAVDASGDLAVGSSAGTSLNVYQHGAFGSPITMTLPSHPSALAFDTQKRLWIAYPSLNAVGRYPSPYTGSADVAVTTSVSAPSAIALDYNNGLNQSDNLYVVNSGGAITVYDSASSYSKDGSWGLTMAGAKSIATCRSTTLTTNYMAISATGTTDFFYTPNVGGGDQLFNVISTPFTSMAFGQNCDLFAINSSYVSFYEYVGNSQWLQYGFISAPSELGLSNLSAFAVYP